MCLPGSVSVTKGTVPIVTFSRENVTSGTVPDVTLSGAVPVVTLWRYCRFSPSVARSTVSRLTSCGMVSSKFTPYQGSFGSCLVTRMVSAV